jgi:hypothetical protein
MAVTVSVDEMQLARFPWRRPVARVAGLSRDEFAARFIVGADGAGEPAIVTDAMDQWACRDWSLTSLQSRFGHLRVRVYARSSRVTPYDTIGYELRLGDYIDYCRSGDRSRPPDQARCITPRADLYPGAGALYWYENFARPEFRPLLDDFDVDVYFLDNLQARLRGEWRRYALFLPFANFFIGGPGTCVDLHKDYWHSHTLIGHLEGRKHVVAFPRSARPHLKNADNEPIDPRCVDAAAFPTFAEAPMWEGMLEPGDMLFLPPNWYHDVLGLTPTLSIGMNIFTVHNIGDYLPHLLSYPHQMFAALKDHPVLGPDLHDADGRRLGDQSRP